MDDHKKLHYHIVTHKICMQKRTDAISCPWIGSIARTEKRCIYSYLSFFFKVDQNIQKIIIRDVPDAHLKPTGDYTATYQTYYAYGRYVKLRLCHPSLCNVFFMRS